MRFRRDDIVWVRFPFSDASSDKVRPALIISNDIINTTSDYLLMQITTRLRGDKLSLVILKENFKESPLLKQSEIKASQNLHS